MKRCLLWFWLCSKRLLKKPLFLVLLLALPALTLCYGLAVEDSGGVVSVVLAADGDADGFTGQVMEALKEDSGLIRFTCASQEEAAMLVETGKADAAWIFPQNLEEKIAAFLLDGATPAVQVLQREENVLLRLSREKLSGMLYGCCVEPVYLRYLRENVPQLNGMSDEQLMDYMDRFQGNDRLFAFEEMDGSPVELDGYLISPLRGMLGVLIQLCALAAAMYFLQDKGAGIYQRVPVSKLGAVEFWGQLAALWSVGLVAMLCLAACGAWTTAWREMAVAVLYMLCCGAFACLLRGLCRKAHVLAGLLPVIAVCMLVVCPVFVDIPGLGVLRYLLPPTYYIQAVYNEAALLWMPVYAGVCRLGCILLDSLTYKK